MPQIATTIAGIVSSDMLLPIKVVLNMREEIPLLDGKRAWFEYITRKAAGKMRQIENMEYNFMEQRIYPMCITVTGVAAAAATQIPVDHPEYAHTRQLVYNTVTGDYYKMNEAIGGTNVAGQIKVTALDGTSGITTATAAGQVLQVLAMAQYEGGALPDPFSAQPNARKAYLFQHDVTRANTDIQKNTKEYGQKQLMIDRIMCWVQEMRKYSMMMYNSQASVETASNSGGKKTYTPSGIMEQIQSNVTDFLTVPGILTLSGIGETMRKVMSHADTSPDKLGIAGQNAIAAISAMPVNAIRTSVNETEWGKDCKTLVTPHGNLSVGYDLLLAKEYGMADKMFILDVAKIERLEMAGLNGATQMLLNIQLSTDIHNQIDAITGTDGLLLGEEELHAQIININ